MHYCPECNDSKVYMAAIVVIAAIDVICGKATAQVFKRFSINFYKK
jgi:hypothetical protein